MTRWHTTLQERFGNFPQHQQLLMVANEINRAHNLIADLQEYRNCLERALELMDLLTADARWRPALRELRRARSLIAEALIAHQATGLQQLNQTLIQLHPAAWNMLQP